MKYRLCFLILFFVLPVCSIAQDKNAILKQALLVAEATKAQDYNTVIKYTHPSLIKMVGGKDAMMNLLTTTMKAVAEQGITLDSISLGQPGNFFTAGNEIHCLLPQNVIMKFGTDKKIVGKGYMMAISNDKGVNWTFLNLTEGLNNKTITKLLPNFNQDLQIPSDRKMEIIDN